MADIMISSQVYRQQLIDLYFGDIREFAVSASEHGGAFFVTLAREKLDVYELCELFEDIALIKNEALITCLPKFYETVREVAFRGGRRQIAQELEIYFAEHNGLCVEGYMNFRLSNLEHIINMTLYTIIGNSMQLRKYRIGETYDN
ncbi:MAG: hypothetical protein FWE92_05125 [Defluviitaleaceae bacterium]|nr:hypothetical protein [Defluviitaleaceae bacterium]